MVKIYETETEIISFVGSGRYCLCDDYKHNIRLYNIVYPSVRHAVLSWKTDDLSIRKSISEAYLPANLKEVENSITETSNMWKIGNIKSFFESYTFKKFNDVPEFAEILLSTGNKNLLGQIPEGLENFFINELQTEKQFEGLVLMKVRDALRKQKAR